jgi:hypothetical protein
MPEFEAPQMPSFEMFGQIEIFPQHQQYGQWGQPQQQFDLKNFHLF